MNQSWLPSGGGNLFQEIKRVRAEAEARGVSILDLSIGQPTGSAFLSAREMAARYIKLDNQEVHEYQDNGCLPAPGFAKHFVQGHMRTRPTSDVDFMPTPGTKSMLPLVILACGRGVQVATMTNPGYGVPAIWNKYLGNKDAYALPTNPKNEFLVDIDDVDDWMMLGKNLLMLNYPHNPSGQVATNAFWENLCAFCMSNGIRIFNDAAYALLDHSGDHANLADVACKFSGLSWAEAFSASKMGNFTGWRVGAIVGSPDFVADIRMIKGDTDSGFNAALAIGALYSLENDAENIRATPKIYQRRLNILIETLTSCRMRLAVKPKAGFFSLWETPKFAFDQRIDDAKHFNYLMIEKTGVLGVHFHPYIRYAVCGDVKAMIEDIREAFSKADVSY